MSAFLGPIHYWLYKKIQVQQEIVDHIVLLTENKNQQNELSCLLDEMYGRFDQRPLEEIIDESNIHGWLQKRVQSVEYKLAYLVTKMLEDKNFTIKDLEEVFLQLGIEHSKGLEVATADSLYQELSNLLLDGMPCDHANSMTTISEDEVIIKRNVCVHEDYWNSVEGDINHYYQLREAFIKGYISNTDFDYVKLDEVTYAIRRSK